MVCVINKCFCRYIIFKKIEKLDYSFHEGFDENAKDLVKKLLVIEPKERLGAKDKTYYSSIRCHPFFHGLDFDNLHKSVPAAVESFVKETDAPDPVWAKYPDQKPGDGNDLIICCCTAKIVDLPKKLSLSPVYFR